MLSNKQLADQARGIARRLTYNDKPAEAEAKHTLLEMAHRFDAQTITVDKKRGGYLIRQGIRNALGKTRYMTFTEGLRYRLFGVVPARV